MKKNIWLLVACVLTSQGLLYGQDDQHQPDKNGYHEFIEMVRQATITYHDIDAAKNQGYVKFGPDMPNMGEHYVNPSYAIRRDLNFDRPSVLTYLPVNGKLLLTGVAYTVPVRPGEQPPDLPFHEARWHYHAGDLMEEAFGLHEKGMHDEKSDIVRLGMLHAWVWSENPDGLFTADNWALAYKRLGLKSPLQPVPDAARSLFMISGGVEYYSRFIDLAIKPTPEILDIITDIMHDYAFTIRQIADTISEQDRVSTSDEIELERIWQALWMDIYETLTHDESSIIRDYLVISHDH